MRTAVFAIALLLPGFALAQPSSENYGFVNYSIGGAYQSASASSSNYGYDQEAGGRYVYDPAATTSDSSEGGDGGSSSETLTEEESDTSTSTEEAATPSPQADPEPGPEPEPEPPAEDPPTTPAPAPEPDSGGGEDDAADSSPEGGGGGGTSLAEGEGDGGGGSAASHTENDDEATTSEAASLDPVNAGVIGRVARAIIPQRTVDAIERTVENVRTQAKKLEPILRTTEPVQEPVQYTGITWGVISAMFATSRIPFAVSNLWHLLIHGWVSLLGFAAARSRRRPWGTVYDSVTKAPLDPAYVELLRQSGDEVTDAITDLDGRYGFVAPEGNYVMRVKKTNYTFPSKRQHQKLANALYDELYFGEPFHAAGAVKKDIPMDPVKFDWNQFEKLRTKQVRYYHRFDYVIYLFLNIVFYLGAAFALWQFLLRFDLITFAVVLIYAIIIGYRFFHGGPILYGTLSRGDRPLPYAVVRVLRDGVDIQRKVADKYGRYVAMVSPGTYEVKVEEQVAEDQYEIIYETTVKAKHGIINEDLSVPAI